VFGVTPAGTPKDCSNAQPAPTARGSTETAQRQHKKGKYRSLRHPSREVARQLIERLTGVRHHPTHVWALLRYRLGWSLQRPQRRAAERNQAAVDHWVNVDWPRIKKRQAPRCGDLLEYRASSGAPRSVTRHAEW
jgi:Winged helix-turn helix